MNVTIQSVNDLSIIKMKPNLNQQNEKWPLPWLRSIGFRYLIAADALALLSLTTLITLLRFGTGWPSFSIAHHLIGFGIVTLVHLTIFYFGGLYEYEQRLGRPAWLPRMTALCLIAFLISAVIGLFSNRFLMPRVSLVLLFITASLLTSFNRWLSCTVRSRRFGKPKVLLVGTKKEIILATKHIKESDLDLELVQSSSHEATLLEKVNSSKATDVLLLNGESINQIYPKPLEELEMRRIGVYKQVTASDTLLGLRRSRQIAGMPFTNLRAHALPKHVLQLKKSLDLLYLLLVLPILLIFFFWTSIYVRIAAGSNIFYKQERVGYLGEPFNLWKFRTMTPDNEIETGAQLAVKNDPRVIKGMHWVRKTRLDELPQLWNVLKGEMSLVGPRPERPKFVSEFKNQIPGYGRRHDTMPGLTGLAQVQGHYQTDPSYKLGHDLQYIVNWSPILDLQILLKTIVVVLKHSAR